MNLPPRVVMPIAYWATIELYRTFLFEDGPLLESLSDAHGHMSGATLARIARLYAVSRTIPAAPGQSADEADAGGHNHAVFAQAVVALARRWPADFQQRARECRLVAADVQCRFVREDSSTAKPRRASGPHSAVTKLIWFLKPDGWTVYDRFAADAVLRSGGNTEERQARFYWMIEKPLARHAAAIQPVLDVFEMRLHAERLLDKFLMMTGMQATGDWTIRCEHFLRLLPSDLSARLRAVAEQVATVLPDNAFPREARRADTLAQLKSRNLFDSKDHH